MSEQGLNPQEAKALQFLRRAIVHEGRTPTVREVAEVMGYRSPRSGQVMVEKLIEAGYLARQAGRALVLVRDLPETSDHERTVEVPLVGNAACGRPLLAEENLEAQIPVSEQLATPGHRYFLLRALGDSMNRVGIEEGALVLVRQQPDAENGETIVALINDEATIKQFWRKENVVVLKPQSSNPDHQPIVLSENFRIQGKVVATIPSF